MGDNIRKVSVTAMLKDHAVNFVKNPSKFSMLENTVLLRNFTENLQECLGTYLLTLQCFT